MVSSYIAQGLRLGHHTIVIARPLHWAGVCERLDRLNIDVERELGRGTLILKDAMDMLRRISPDGTPDPAAFAEHVGAAIRGLAARGPVSAYGEMVDLLAQRGEFEEAVRLESMWNGLAHEVSFSLLCGYGAAHFVSPASYGALRDICSEHTDVRRHEQDALANWLLMAAHDPVASSAMVQ